MDCEEADEHSTALAARATLILFGNKKSCSVLGDVQLLLCCWAVTCLSSASHRGWQNPPGKTAGVVNQKTLLLIKWLCSCPVFTSPNLQYVALQQVLMFGAVGAFDWSGGILLYDLATKTAVFLNESKEEAKTAKYSYLGNQLPPF